MLDDMFKLQRELNLKIVPELEELTKTEEGKKEWVTKMLIALDQEKSEAIDSLSWKWWKKGQNDFKNLRIELVDILHFLISAMQISGMSATDVYSLYTKKNELNHRRQDGGYKDGSYQKVVNGVEDNESIS